MPGRSKDPIRSKRSALASKQALVKHKWLRLDPEGTTAVLQTGKHALTQRLGVQACGPASHSALFHPLFDGLLLT